MWSSSSLKSKAGGVAESCCRLTDVRSARSTISTLCVLYNFDVGLAHSARRRLHGALTPEPAEAPGGERDVEDAGGGGAAVCSLCVLQQKTSVNYNESIC